MKKLELLKRKLERERKARKQAEQILEKKALELFQANQSLKQLNENLEDEINQRIYDLQISESTFRNVIEHATDMFYTIDEYGYFTFINPTFCETFGYEINEIIGTIFTEYIVEGYKKDVIVHYSNYKAQKLTNDYYEFPAKTKDGKILWLGQNVNRIEISNNRISFNAVARDITLRKNTEKQLETAIQAVQLSEVKYRSALENMDLGLMEIDNKGVITRVYDKFCKLTGYTKEELVGKVANTTLVVEGHEETIRNQNAKRQKGISGIYELQIKRKDDKPIWVIISGAPFYNTEGEIVGSLGIHFDLTDRKNLEANLEIAKEKAIRAQQAEKQFLANMSHEIRTPLNAIIGMSHLLKDSKLNETQKEYLDILSNSASLLKGLVSDILDISKIDSGTVEMNETIFNLCGLAETLIKTFNTEAQEKQIKLISNINCKNNNIVEADKQWINQILINLLSNATKFTAKGHITLTIIHISKFDTKSTYFFEVSDTGIGISPDDLERIFVPFKQSNTTNHRKFGGTGLGLSISSQLVSLLGGKLEVTSKINKGSKFYFTLQLKTILEKRDFSKKQRALRKEFAKGIKVLVVEDNLMNQKYIISLLNTWNIKYDIANNGLEAVQICKRNNYNLIFMDLSMPIMDGYEASIKIRKMSGLKIPIIALTATNFLSKKELALQSGMTDFLAKPFTPSELSQMLEKHIKPYFQSSNIIKTTNNFSEELDFIFLNKIYEGDNNSALEMFEAYDDIIEEEINLLCNLVYDNDFDKIKQNIHKIKPIFSMVGLGHLTIASEAIEDLMNQNNTSDAINEILLLKENIFATLPIIKKEINRLKKILSQQNKDN